MNSKQIFLAHFSIFQAKKLFQKSSCHAQLQKSFQHHAKILEKLMIWFKKMSGQRTGWKDEQTLVYRTFLATGSGLI